MNDGNTTNNGTREHPESAWVVFSDHCETDDCAVRKTSEIPHHHSRRYYRSQTVGEEEGSFRSRTQPEWEAAYGWYLTRECFERDMEQRASRDKTENTV
jgi:hypothetical protein